MGMKKSLRIRQDSGNVEKMAGQTHLIRSY
jgi:hypothetical protein